MKRAKRVWLSIVVGLAVAALPLGLASAAVPKKQAAEEVEMFAAMKAGDIEVRLVPKDSTQSTVHIKNKTKKPLSIKLPAAFAGVPVLAQAGNNNNSNTSNVNQGIGGGMMGGGMMGGGMGGGMFNIAPEAVRKAKVATVCLEHGKKEPKPSVQYEIRPIDSFTQDARVHELVKLLATGRCSQRVAQAAAWHFANDMSWEQLASKERKHLNAPSEPYFSRQEIVAALALARTAVARAEQQQSAKPDSASLSKRD